jgi:hypothetical protein
MSAGTTFRVILIKPSKYARDGYVERFRKGFMPNSTLLHLKSMTPPELGGRPVVVTTIDEYTQTDLRYLDLLRPETCSLLAVIGVQSHQPSDAPRPRSCGAGADEWRAQLCRRRSPSHDL